MKPDEQLDNTVDTPPRSDTPPEPGWISPLNPVTYPRAEDDEETFARSPEFRDRPDPGPNVGRDREES